MDLLERLAVMTIAARSVPGSHPMTGDQCHEIDVNYK
jgi:hypothetical protein